MSQIKSKLEECKYKFPKESAKDIENLYMQYQSLKVETGSFSVRVGRVKQLVHLKGTIPILFKGNQYHIPVKIWLLDNHPNSPPVVKVDPTQDMRIRVSRLVDHNGKVYLPFLTNWDPKPPVSSDLVSLVKVLINEFGHSPPVYNSKFSSRTDPVPGWTAGTTMPMPSTSTNPEFDSLLPMDEKHVQRLTLLEAAKASISAKLRESYASIRVAEQVHKDLDLGSLNLTTMMEKLEDEKATLEKNVSIGVQELQRLEGEIQQLKSEDKKSPSVESAIAPPTILHLQIVNLYAEEAAIEDTIFHLAGALQREVIDIDQFLKAVRSLTRRQFQLKALLDKCRVKAGLSG